jgi:hypothetical protein
MLSLLALHFFRVTFRLPDLPGEHCTFLQKLDHFNSTDARTFSQRYILDERYSPSKTSFVVYINCGFNATDLLGGPIYEIANGANASLVFLELRFYGESFPTPPTAANLAAYHTVAQCVEDIGVFIATLRPPNCRVLLVGGFFAGTLAAYARVKFPHLVDFAWSSSSLFDYDVDHRIFNSLADTRLWELTSDECHANANALTPKIASLAASNPAMLCARLGMTAPASALAMLNVVITGIADSVQLYTRTGGRDLREFCDNAKGILPFIVWFAKKMVDIDSFNPEQYGKWNQSGMADGRSWFWQQCSEIGWFRTSASGTFSDINLRIQYFAGVCTDLFARPIVTESDQVSLRRRYGGAILNITNLIVSHGGWDLWEDIAGLHGFRNDSMKRVEVYISASSHCSDICAEKGTDSVELVEARKQIVGIAVDWLGNRCGDECANGKCVLGECVCEGGFEGEFCNERTLSDLEWKVFSALLMFLPTIAVIAVGLGGWWALSGEDSALKFTRL